MAIRKPSFVRLLVLLSLTVLSLGGHQANPEECPLWKDIASSEGFQQHIVAASELAHLDIGLPPEFGVDESFVLVQLLRKLPISVRVLRGTSVLRQQLYTSTVQQDHYALVLVLCKSTAWNLYSIFFDNPHVMHLYVIADNIWGYQHSHTDLRHLSEVMQRDSLMIRSGVAFVFAVHRKLIIAVKHLEYQCLNCSKISQIVSSMNFLKDRSIHGIAVKMNCQHPNFCDKAQFEALDSIVKQRNASFHVTKITTFNQVFLSLMQSYSDPCSLFYFSFLDRRTDFFPSMSTTFPYDSVNMIFYGKDSEPVLKEAVLFLPFDWFIWLAILVSFSFLFITGYIITKLLNKKRANIHILALPFAALLLQQGPPTSRENERFLSLRFILGTCALSATVLATGYKGVLVSLFSNVPLAGEAITATTYKNQRTGFRLCILSELLAEEVEGDLTLKSKECFEASGRIKKEKDGKNVYLIFGSGYEEADNFKDQLLGWNYRESVWLEVLTGPQIGTNSPYRNDTSNLFSRAFEAGIFKRFVSLANHKRFGTREFKMPRALTNEEPVTLNDLRPCFVLWLGGIILSSAVFILEKIAEIAQGLALLRNRRRVLHR